MFIRAVVLLLTFQAVTSQAALEASLEEKFPVGRNSIAVANAIFTIISSFYVDTISSVNFITSCSNDDSQDFADDIASKLLKRISPYVEVVIETNEGIKDIGYRRFYNLILVDSYESFHKIFNKMNAEYFDYRGLYVVIMTMQNRTHYEEMRQILEDLWSNYIVNVNVVVPVEGSKPRKCRIYTYFPFTRSHCEEVHPVWINTFTVGKGFKKEIDHFPNKVSNLFGCPVTVATSEMPPFMIITYENDEMVIRGIEGILMQEIAGSMNFTLKIKLINDTSWGGNKEKMSRNLGPNQMVIRGEVNFSAGYIISSPLKNTLMSSTDVYITSNLVWVIGPGRTLSSFERFSKPFDGAVWLWIIITFTVSIVVILIVRIQSKAIRNFVFGNHVKHPILNLVNITLGGVMRTVPRRNFSRTLLAFFLFYSLIMRSAYTGAFFFKFLQTGKTEVEVKDMADMLRKNYTFYLLDAVKEYIFSLPELRHNSLILNNAQFEANRHFLMYSEEKIALLASEDHVNYWNQQQHTSKRFNICQEKLAVSNLVFYLSKKSCLMPEFNRLILHYNSYGFVSLYQRIYVDEMYARKTRLSRNEPKTVSFDHLKGAFVLLSIGFGLACISFAVEVCRKRRKARKAKRVVNNNKRKKLKASRRL